MIKAFFKKNMLLYFNGLLFIITYAVSFILFSEVPVSDNPTMSFILAFLSSISLLLIVFLLLIDPILGNEQFIYKIDYIFKRESYLKEVLKWLFASDTIRFTVKNKKLYATIMDDVLALVLSRTIQLDENNGFYIKLPFIGYPVYVADAIYLDLTSKTKLNIEDVFKLYRYPNIKITLTQLKKLKQYGYKVAYSIDEFLADLPRELRKDIRNNLLHCPYYDMMISYDKHHTLIIIYDVDKQNDKYVCRVLTNHFGLKSIGVNENSTNYYSCMIGRYDLSFPYLINPLLFSSLEITYSSDVKTYIVSSRMWIRFANYKNFKFRFALAYPIYGNRHKGYKKFSKRVIKTLTVFTEEKRAGLMETNFMYYTPPCNDIVNYSKKGIFFYNVGEIKSLRDYRITLIEKELLFDIRAN